MDPVIINPAVPTPVPAPAPAPTPTLADQIRSQQAPAAPVAPVPAATPAVTPVSDATPPSVPPADSTLQDKLAEAEKRLQDTQRWGHKNAEEAAKLKAALSSIQQHPVVGKLLEAMAQGIPAPQNQAQAQEQAEIQSAWKEYNEAKTEEEAFAKILKFAETRGAKRALTEFNQTQATKENEARIVQRNQLTVQAINTSVTTSAPDVPLELFWAMSGRAEAECPPQITDYAERLQWQVGRAVDLSRSVLGPRVAAAAAGAVTQTQVNQQAGAIMPGGGAAPVAPAAGTPVAPKTMADFIKDMQRKQLERRG